MANDPVPTGKSNNDLLAKFVENQHRELEFKAQELEFERQKDNNSLDYAKESLAAQERDRIHERDCKRNQRRDQQRMILWIAVLLVALILGAIYLGSEQIGLELAKALGFMAAGAVGGYGYARRSKQDSDEE